MKRDMDLARKILFAIEKSADDTRSSIRLPEREYATLHLSHHIRLLKEAGFIHAVEAFHSLSATTAWVPHSLTWQGYDFLNLVRDEEVWKAIKAEQVRLGNELPTELIVEFASSLMRNKINKLEAA